MINGIQESNNIDNIKFLTLQEVAKILKVSYITVFRWVKSGKLNSVKAGKQYRISSIELNNFLNKKNEKRN